VYGSDKLGLVLVDRSTVPVGGGNITLSFGAYPNELPGRVRFLHPLHNFAILSYDPTRLSHQVSQEPKALLPLQTPVAVCVRVHACMRACTFTQLECSLMLAVLLKGNIAPEMLLFTSAKMCLQILDIGLPRRLMLRHLSHCSSHVLRMHLQASHSGPRSTSDHPTPLTLHQRLSLIVS